MVSEDSNDELVPLHPDQDLDLGALQNIDDSSLESSEDSDDNLEAPEDATEEITPNDSNQEASTRVDNDTLPESSEDTLSTTPQKKVLVVFQQHEQDINKKAPTLSRSESLKLSEVASAKLSMLI